MVYDYSKIKKTILKLGVALVFGIIFFTGPTTHEAFAASCASPVWSVGSAAVSSATIPTTGKLIGAFKDTCGTTTQNNADTVSVVKLTMSSVTGITNLKIFTDQVTNCTTSNPSTQFGSTIANPTTGNGANVFNGSVTIAASAFRCFYVVYDIGTSATEAETVAVSVNAYADITESRPGGSLNSTPLSLGTTTLNRVTTVAMTGTQTTSLLTNNAGQFVGGAFTLTRSDGTANVTSIGVTIAGTSLTGAEIANMKLYTDTIASCTTTSGFSSQVGSTIASPIVGKNTFGSLTLSVGATPVCVYVIIDTTASSVAGHTLEISIAASGDVATASGIIGGTFAVAVSGTSTFIAPITISGTCKAYDQTTDCGDTGEIKFAVDGVLDTTHTQTTVAGTWSITNVPPPASGAVITIFIDGAADTDEAVAVTKYDGSGDIDLIRLYKEHVTIGTDTGSANSGQSLTNTNLSAYDNSVSGDEDIFFDYNSSSFTCDGLASFRGLCLDQTGQSTQERLYILSGNTFSPGGGGFNNVALSKMQVAGTFSPLDATTFLGNGTSTTCGSTTQMPFCITGTYNTSGRVQFFGTSATTIASTTYSLLDFGTDATIVGNSTVTYTLAGNISGSNVAIGTATGTGTQTLAISSFTLSATGSLTINARGNINGGSGTITLSASGIPIQLSGTFTANTSTVKYTSATGVTGLSSAAMTGSNAFYNLEVAGTGTFTEGQDITATNNLTVTSGTLSGSNTVIVNGNVTGGGTISLTAGTFEQRVSASRTFGAASGAVGWTFNNLTFSNGNSASHTITAGAGTGTITVSGNMLIGKSGDNVAAPTVLDAGNRTWTLSGSGTPLSILGSPAGSICPNSTCSGNTSTFNYTGTTATTIAAATYYDLGIGTTANSSSLTYTLGGDTSLRKLTVGAGTGTGTHTFDASSYTLTITGTGTTSSRPFQIGTLGSFTASTSTVIYTGSGASTDIAYSITYNNLKILPGASTTFRLASVTGSTTTINGDLTLGDGTVSGAILNDSALNSNLNIHGNMTICASPCSNSFTYTKGTGTTTFNGTTAATYTDNTATPQNLGIVVQNKTDTGAPATNNKLTLASSMTVDTFQLGAAGSETHADTFDLGSGGYTFTLSSSAIQRPLTTYTGATFTAGNSTVVYTGVYGPADMFIKGSTAGTANPTFYNLTLSPNSAENYDSVSTVSVTNNFTINTNATLVTSATIGGNFTGSGTLSLSSGLIKMSCRISVCLVGPTGSNDWSFGELRAYTSNSAGGASIVRTASTASCTPTCGIIKVLVDLSIGDPAAVDVTYSVTFDNETNDRVLDVDSTVTFNSFSGYAVDFQASSSALFTVGWSWYGPITSDGTFTAGSGTVTFDGGSIGQTLTGSMTGSSKFNNIIFNNASGAWSFGANAAEVAGDFTVVDGAVTGPSTTLTLRGDMTLDSDSDATSGTFISGGGTVIFAKGGAQTFDDSFISNLGTVQISANGTDTNLLASNLTATTLTVDSNQTWRPSNTNKITGSGTPLVINGTVSPVTNSTVAFQGTTDTTIPATNYYNLFIFNESGTPTYTLGSGTFTIGGNFETDLATGAVVVTAATSNPIIDISGNFSNKSGVTFIAPGSASFTVAGNFYNAGTFNANGGTVTFDGSGIMNIGNAIHNASTTFNNIVDTTPGSTLKFYHHTTNVPLYTIAGTLTVTGSSGNNITITSDDGTNPWLVHFNNAQSSVSYATISYSGCDGTSATVSLSNATDGSPGGTNGSCWQFSVTRTISGSIYQSNDSTLDTTAYNLLLSVAGGTATPTTAAGDGTFSFSITGPTSGQVVTIWIDGNANDATLVFKYGSSCTGNPNCEGLRLTVGQVRLDIKDASSWANGSLGACTDTDGTGCSDADIAFDTDGSNNLTVDAGHTLVVTSGVTFAPGANVTTPVLNVAGTYTGSSETLTLNGTGTPLVAAGTFTVPTTVNYTGTSSGVTVKNVAYTNLGVGTTGDANTAAYTLAGDTSVSGVLTIGAGTGAGTHSLDASSFTLTLSGSGTPITRNSQGVFTGSTSTVTYTSGSGISGLSSAAMTGSNAFYNLTINGTGTFNAGSSIAVEAKNNLVVSGGTLAMGANDLTVGNSSNSNSGNIKVASSQSLTQTSTNTTTVLSSVSGTNCIGGNAASCDTTVGTITFGSLTIGNGSTTFTTTLGDGGGNAPTMTVSTVFTITASATFDDGTGLVVLAGTGTPLAVSGAYASGQNIKYTGSGSNVNVAALQWMTGLEFAPTSSTTFIMSGSTWGAASLIVGNNATVDMDTNDPNFYVSSLTLNSSSVWTKSATATLYIRTSCGAASVTDNNATKQNLGIVSDDAGCSALTLGSSIKVTSLNIPNGSSVSLNGANTLTITGTGTPFTIGATATFTPSTGTVLYNPPDASTVTVAPTTYHNVTFDSDHITQNSTTFFNLTTGGITTDLGGDLTIAHGTVDTISGQNYPISVGGSFFNTGGFTPQNGTVTFTSTSTGKTIAPPSFYDVVFSGTNGGWSFTSATTTLSHNLTMTAGTLSGTNNLTVNGGGASGDGTINLTGGTFLLDGTGNFGGANPWTFNDLTFGDGTGSATSTASGAGGVTVSGALAIAANQTLDAGSKTWTLSGTSGTPFTNSGTFTPSTSTVAYTGNNGGGNTTVANVTYNNLTLNNATPETYVLPSGTLSIGNNFTTTAGAFSHNSGTVNFTATSSGKTISTNGSQFNNVTFSGVNGGWSNSDAMTLAGDLTMTNGTLSGTNNVTVNGGDVTGDGTINLTGGTFLVDGNSSTGFGGDTGWTFNNLTFGNGTGAESTTSTGTGSIAATGTMTIAANQTLNAGSKTWTLSGSGTPITRAGIFTGGTSTFTYTSTTGITALSSAAMTGSNAFYNLIINRSGQTFTAGVAAEAKNNLTVTNGILAMAGNNLTVGSTDNANSGSIKVASGQSLTQSSAGTTTILSSAAGANCIGSNGANCSGTAGTLTFGGLIIGDDSTAFVTTIGATNPTVTIAGDLVINNNATLDAGSATLSLTNNGTTVLTKDAAGALVTSSRDDNGLFSGSTVSFDSVGTNGTTVPGLTYYNLTLNKGSNTFTAGGVTTVAGNFTLSAGTYVAPSGNLAIAGDFSNSGTFTANGGTVLFNGKGNSNITGNSNTTFATFASIPDDEGKDLIFKAGKTYTFATALNLSNPNGATIALHSDTPGQQWLMTLNGTYSLSHLKVYDSGCSGGATIDAVGNYTIDDYGGNGPCWQFFAPTIFRGGLGNVEASATPQAPHTGGSGGGTGGAGGGNTGGEGGGTGGVSQASGHAVLTENAVSSVVVDSGGSGYSTPPSVGFCGGGGSGAAATTTLQSGSVSGVNMISGGSNYTSAPTVVFGGTCGGTGGGSGGAGGGDSGFNYVGSNLASVGAAPTLGLWNFFKNLLSFAW